MSNKRVKSKAVVSDSNDSDSADDGADMQKSKKQKTENKPKAASSKLDSDGNPMWELGKMKRVTVSKFKGKVCVGIREFYVDQSSGKERPGKKGISLNTEQWQELVNIIEDVNEAVAKS